MPAESWFKLHLVILLIVFILPASKVSSQTLSEILLEKTILNFTQFDYFYILRERIVGNWSYKIDSFENGNANLYYDPSYDTSSWDRVEVPFLYKAVQSNSSMWVRLSFKTPKVMKGQRLRLVFQGVWGIGKAWLNGAYLGEHYSYFSPFFFDIDDAVNLNGVNVLTLHIESPVLRYPYESRVYPAGPYSFSEVFPKINYSLIGVWRDVMLVGTYDATVNLVLVDVKQYSNPASLSFRVLIQNKVDADENFSAVLRIRKLDPANTTVVEQSFSIGLHSKERRWYTFDISLPNPEFWAPWDRGASNVYTVNISLYQNDAYAGSIQTFFGLRSLEASFSWPRPYLKINEVNTFLRGGAYFTKYCPLTNFYPEINETLNILKDGNINFLRAFAHVAPKEFYELTSIEGVIVQADFPLLGSYPSLDYSQRYSELVKKQLIEFLLLTYNYPSVIIIRPHTLPGWMNEKSMYYDSRVNYYLDSELERLARTVKTDIVLLPYSGNYETYFDYGWGTDDWTRYTYYRGVFPNIIVPTSLPSLDSCFWNSTQASSYEQTLQLLREKGLDLQLANAYWLSMSNNVSSLVELSQNYQSLVLRCAIDRARILKNSVSIGISLLPLTDYLPNVTGSIVDYYGFVKQSYYEVKNAFNPIHTVIMVDGDYQNSVTSLCFLAGSTTRINLWVVNDAFQEELDAVLYWRLIDRSLNEVVSDERIELKLPSSSSGATLVRRHVFEAPHYDNEHLFEVSTELYLKNGTKLDANSQRFVIKPLLPLKISLYPKPSKPQYFLILMNDHYRIVKILNETVITVPSDTEVTIIGPSLNRADLYVPKMVSLGRLYGGREREVTISLCPGALVKVLTKIPSFNASVVTTQELYVNLIGEKIDDLLLNYTLQRTHILNLLNITGNMIIVPAEKNLSIGISASSKLGVITVKIGDEDNPINLHSGSEIYFDQPAMIQAKLNQPAVDRALASAENLVEDARNMGFYMGLEAYRLNQLKELNSLIINSSDPLEILIYQQEIITSSKTITESVQNMVNEAGLNQVLIFVVIIPLAFAIGSLFVEKKKYFATATAISFIVLAIITYLVFPVFSMASPLGLLGGACTILIFAIMFLAPRFLGEGKSERGVSILPAIIIAISYSIRNLKKRRSRALLTLSSMTMMVLALATLTSMRADFGINSLLLVKTWPADKPSYSIISRPQGYLTYEDLSFINAQKEVLKLGYRMVSPTTSRALGFIEGIPVYGVLGISGDSPSFEQLNNIISEEGVMEKLFTESDSALISRYLADAANIDVGTVMFFRGVKLKVVGIFDGDAVSNLKEPVDIDFLPLYFPSMMASATPVPGNYLLITNAYVAEKLGCRISAVYCTFKDNAQAKEASERLSRLGNYFVVTMPSSEGIRYYFTGIYVEVFGSTVVIPIIITMLNIAVVFYMLVYEREKEIFTLSSIGLNPTHISFLFLAESAVVGFISCGIGYISSMLIFKILNTFNVIVPVNVKASVFDMIYLMSIAVTAAVFSSMIPALRAAKIATPSLLRRWKIEEKIVKGDTWTVKLPLKISTEKVEMFAKYLYGQLSKSSMLLELKISEVSHDENVDEAGNIIYHISFKYGKGGNRPFNAYTTIEVKKDGENYVAYVHAKIESPYQRMEQENVHEVVTHIRRLILEWSATVNQFYEKTT
ncbi:MAG: FtsX-like permease family protein [Thermoproteota archaeon]